MPLSYSLRRLSTGVVMVGLLSCHASERGEPAHPTATDAPSADASPTEAPAGPMTRKDAERYILSLINQDRKAAGLNPVVWDETAAEAGRRHAADMATHGFTAHLGTDGSVPEQRYTEAGGQDLSMENAGCFGDGKTRALNPDARFTAKGLEEVEKAFIGEKPPSDGHRRNILAPAHTAVGVGLAQPVGVDSPCMAQEFVDHYGAYGSLPKKAAVGAKLHLTGKLESPATVAGVGLSRIDKPRPVKVADLTKPRSYPIPKPYVMYFPAQFKTPIPIQVAPDGSFSIDVPLSDGGKAGRYGVSVWATLGSSKELAMVSLRTIDVN
jgi:uncharacterized protein YkwD